MGGDKSNPITEGRKMEWNGSEEELNVEWHRRVEFRRENRAQAE
jgi:hypothetical protein